MYHVRLFVHILRMLSISVRIIFVSFGIYSILVPLHTYIYINTYTVTIARAIRIQTQTTNTYISIHISIFKYLDAQNIL